MGMAICRLTDMTMGHGCFPPQVIIQGSETVFIEGLPAHRQGDAIQPHCCKTCHPSAGGPGSPTVFVNGRAVQRVMDTATCGSVLMTGAKTVRAG